MHHLYAMWCIESVTPQGDLLIKFTSPLLSYALDIRWLRHVRRIPIMYRNAQCSHFLKALHMDISSSWPRSRKDCRWIYQAPWYIDIKRYFKLISSCFRSLISPSPPSESVTDPELWGLPLRKNVDIAQYSDAWNLSLYLRKYWSREKGQNLSDTVISGTLIAVAPQLYYNTISYDCLEYPTSRSKKLTAFVTLLIPVDANAEESDEPVQSVYRCYFAETVLFLHTNTKVYINFL